MANIDGAAGSGRAGWVANPRHHSAELILLRKSSTGQWTENNNMKTSKINIGDLYSDHWINAQVGEQLELVCVGFDGQSTVTATITATGNSEFSGLFRHWHNASEHVRTATVEELQKAVDVFERHRGFCEDVGASYAALCKDFAPFLRHAMNAGCTLTPDLITALL